MSRDARTDLLVGRELTFTSHIARLYFNDSLQSLDNRFDTPKTSAAKICDFSARLINTFWHEFHRKRVYTVTNVLIGLALSCENMSKMSPAGCTCNLCTNTIGIICLFHAPRNCVIKARPAAVAVELIAAAIQRRTTTTTDICSFLFIVDVFTREWHLCSFVFYDVLLFRSKFISCILHEK